MKLFLSKPPLVALILFAGLTFVNAGPINVRWAFPVTPYARHSSSPQAAPECRHLSPFAPRQYLGAYH
ncbi:hypothetical protein BDZ94DRAFT_925847 [Collybia nuda]|uniref:Uncharacterized protein n=1 Tax=Collybia nuda TaxID=64659 RepID=A0A9P6CC89_9AGAR|nr:hypothetical protein BDZ94DRAFT_925847 [Collybia nuda]